MARFVIRSRLLGIVYLCPVIKVHFNVFSAQRPGRAWGAFTTDTEVPAGLAGPSYHETFPATPVSASKVSNSNGSWDTVLIARLRFKPDVDEPTSL